MNAGTFHYDVEQRTPEWHALRLGKVTASSVQEVIAKQKNGSYYAGRDNYMAQLMVERLTGAAAEDRYVSKEMQWGTEHEDQARAAYMFARDIEQIVKCGFVDHPVIPMTGASPDGIVYRDGQAVGLVEIKCPNTSTHADTIRRRVIPIRYVSQAQFQMACTGLPWVDYVSFDPRLPVRMQLKVLRIERSAEAIDAIEYEVRKFQDELRNMIEDMEEKSALTD